MDAGETASASASWSWTVCLFISGIFFGTFISGLLLYWKSSLKRKFRALLSYPPSSHQSPLGHQDTDSVYPMDSDIIQDSPLVKEDTCSTHPLDSNINQGCPLSQEDSTSTHSWEPKSIQRRPSSRRVYEYDVFLSFRYTGPCCRFIDQLYNGLKRKGFVTFKNDERLEKGEPISSQLLQAIKYSRISIIIFTSDYADSTWCLEEMAAIVDCHEEWKQIIFPVFYDADPSHVLEQSGVYEDAFVSHAERFKEDQGKVERWRRAMMIAANLCGWHAVCRQEFTVIEDIIQAVMDRLGHELSSCRDDPVGIQAHVEYLEKLLKLSSKDDDFRVLGICGMGGIGKTTLAIALYEKFSDHFEAACFIRDVSKIYRDGGTIHVQKRILRGILDEQTLEIYSPFIRRRLSRIRVLIVLDDVDELEQLKAISPKLLGVGSRIIIITRDEHILKVYGADYIYKVPPLDYNDAYELFLRTAFKGVLSPSSNNCMGLIREILEYAQGFPLAIKVMASFLNAHNATEWESILVKMRKFPDEKIMSSLQISFEGLSSNEREIFLHIACFFHGKKEEYVKRILDSCGLYSCIGIHIIMEKSLITIKNKKIHMHEMLQELGKKIVSEQFPEKPELWSRLWLYEDFENVLMSRKETSNVKAIVLDHKKDVSKGDRLRIEGLSKMRNLKLLILYHENFSGRLKYLSNNLRYLLWHGFPFSSLPSFHPVSRLVELNLPKSTIKRLWEGCKNFPYLEKVDLSNSEHLMETPNFEGSPNLKWLDLTGCTNLRLVHPSIGFLTKLVYLSLQDCIHLVSLDLDTECKLSSLRVLRFSRCAKLKRTPNFTGLSSLKYLDLEQCTNLLTVHESIGALTALKFLSLRGCSRLVEIPNCVNNMTSLQTLDLSSCINLKNLPLGQKVTSSSYLKSLIFKGLGLYELRGIPDAIGELRCLEELDLERSYFSFVPDTTVRLSKLAYLNLTHYCGLTRLRELSFGSKQYPHLVIISQDYIFSTATGS